MIGLVLISEISHFTPGHFSVMMLRKISLVNCSL